jgi:hypothetical protein
LPNGILVILDETFVTGEIRILILLVSLKLNVPLQWLCLYAVDDVCRQNAFTILSLCLFTCTLFFSLKSDSLGFQISDDLSCYYLKKVITTDRSVCCILAFAQDADCL